MVRACSYQYPGSITANIYELNGCLGGQACFIAGLSCLKMSLTGSCMLAGSSRKATFLKVVAGGTRHAGQYPATIVHSWARHSHFCLIPQNARLSLLVEGPDSVAI